MFFGTDDFSLRSLKALHTAQRTGDLIRRLDVVSVLLKKSTPAVRRYCQKEGLEVIDWPVVVPQGVYDIGIVVSFGHLIPASVISAFPMGIINLHGSLLPRWRGAAPVIHTLLNNDHLTGITIMRIAPRRFDVGHVVSKVEVQVKWNTKSKELTAHLAEVGAQELVSLLPNLPEHLNKAYPQSSEGVTKAPKVDERASRAQWSEWSCSDVQARFRALDDYMPLWTLWQEKPAKLRSMVMQQEWSMKTKDTETDLPAESDGSEKKNGTQKLVTDDKKVKNGSADANSPRNYGCDSLDNQSQKMDEMEVPGRVVYDRKQRVIRVHCRDGWVAFQRVILKGHRPMTAQDFYNGFITKVPKDSHIFT